MVAQTAYVVDGFCFNICKEGRVDFVRLTGEHEVLPYEDARFVTGAVEGVVLVDATAPDADDVHVDGSCVGHDLTIDAVGDASEEVVVGNHIGAFGKKGLAVELEIEVLARQATFGRAMAMLVGVVVEA